MKRLRKNRKTKANLCSTLKSLLVSKKIHCLKQSLNTKMISQNPFKQNNNSNKELKILIKLH